MNWGDNLDTSGGSGKKHRRHRRHSVDDLSEEEEVRITSISEDLHGGFRERGEWGKNI